jgi:biopolymer transport protein ExbD
MLDVLMTVLTFFIVVSMTLTLEKNVDIELPNNEASAPPTNTSTAPLVVKLNPQGQLLLNDKPSAQDQVIPQLKAYLAANPKGFVVLQADPQLPYEKVVQQLADLKDVGGDRVSLAIE